MGSDAVRYTSRAWTRSGAAGRAACARSSSCRKTAGTGTPEPSSWRPLTGRARKMIPTHVALPASGRLKRASTVMLEHIRKIDKSRLERCIGIASHESMTEVCVAIAVSMGLDGDGAFPAADSRGPIPLEGDKGRTSRARPKPATESQARSQAHPSQTRTLFVLQTLAKNGASAS